ncbi:MAG: hypothetical protein KBS64_02475 [Treponema sp.]|nr:hypothetical protein [Candidatus Treponema equi]
MNEWFICLTYDKINFLIPHNYCIESNCEPDIFIDFDTLVLNYFNTSNTVKHPAALNIKCSKLAILTTSSIPTVVQVDLQSFFVPSGVLENGARSMGVMAMSFWKEKSDGKLSIIVNPELLYEKWNEKHG